MGAIHNYRREKDRKRDEILEKLGFKILRIKNEELKDINKVIIKIKKLL